MLLLAPSENLEGLSCSAEEWMDRHEGARPSVRRHGPY